MRIIKKLLRKASEKELKEKSIKRRKHLESLFFKEKYSKFHINFRESRLSLERALKKS